MRMIADRTENIRHHRGQHFQTRMAWCAEFGARRLFVGLAIVRIETMSGLGACECGSKRHYAAANLYAAVTSPFVGRTAALPGNTVVAKARSSTRR